MWLSSTLRCCHTLPCKYASKRLSHYTWVKFCIAPPWLHNHWWTCRSCQQSRQLPRSAWRSYAHLSHRQETKSTGLTPTADLTTSQNTEKELLSKTRTSEEFTVGRTKPSHRQSTWHLQWDMSNMSAGCIHLQPTFTYRHLELSLGQPPQTGHPSTGTPTYTVGLGKGARQNPRAKQNPAHRTNVVTCLCASEQYRYSCQWRWQSSTAASCPSSPGSAGFSPGSSETKRNLVLENFSYVKFQGRFALKN